MVGSANPAALLEEIRNAHPRLIVQRFSKRAVSNEFFVEMVATQTLRAAVIGNLIAKKPEIDLLLRIAGTTQISAAIGKAGAKKGETFVVVVAGEKGQISSLKARPGWTRLPRRPLSQEELVRIEKAALLNALR
jgi:tRNA threonylcarbamoyladenosine modification (KEOPS) complex Cgi121 subunit